MLSVIAFKNVLFSQSQMSEISKMKMLSPYIN